MKKRSLVAALAMLVVSAIVLTSATYAWFATSAAADVQSITATVSNNNGSVSVAATGTNAKSTSADVYKVRITSADYENLCTNLNPVSMSWNSGPQFNKVSYDTTTFSSFAAGSQNGDYLTYQFKVKGANAADAQATKSVTLTPTFTTNTGAFCNGLISVNDGTTTTYYSYIAGGSYESLIALTNTTITDTNGNGIVDNGDAGLAAATDLATIPTAQNNGPTVGTSGSAITILSGIAAGSSAEATVTVWVWAEGQDSGCVGNVNAETAYFTFDVA